MISPKSVYADSAQRESRSLAAYIKLAIARSAVGHWSDRLCWI
ncbi:MAG: hypothetical protein V7K69_05425 [Nostoc sp.]